VKIACIANSHAGRGRARAWIDDIRSRAASLDLDVTVSNTEAPGDGTYLARELRANADIIGIIGGDGTVHEVVSGLMPNPPPIVIFPAGTGNDYASLVQGPADLDDLHSMIQAGLGARMDVLECNDRFIVNSAGLGFEGMVNQRSHQIRAIKGPALYLLAVFKTLSALTCPHFDIRTAEGQRIEGRKLLVSVGNGVRSGGAFYLTPTALPDDGLIDVCMVEPMSRLKVVRVLPKSFNGSHVAIREVTMLRTESLTIRTEPAFPMHIDGELIDNAPEELRIRVRKRILPILCRESDGNRLSHSLEQVL
jgi:diacylglycerol kinase (ATP)